MKKNRPKRIFHVEDFDLTDFESPAVNPDERL
jgi:hypothetical protein